MNKPIGNKRRFSVSVILITAGVFLLLSGCSGDITFLDKPDDLLDIPYEHESLFFNGTEVRYLLPEQYDENSEDIIFYFHGMNNSEYSWLAPGAQGSVYYSILEEHPEFESNPVVAISFGSIYLLLDQLPDPYNADLETIFLEELVPYFREKLDRQGNIYLIGFSMGGFNAASMAMRHPDMFPGVALISPYTAPISPFEEEFDEFGKTNGMSRLSVSFTKNLLTSAFQTPERWDEYNPYYLAETQEKHPYIVMSATTEDLPGFEWAMNTFSDTLTESGIDHKSCVSPGTHGAVCADVFTNFLDWITARENRCNSHVEDTAPDMRTIFTAGFSIQ